MSLTRIFSAGVGAGLSCRVIIRYADTTVQEVYIKTIRVPLDRRAPRLFRWREHGRRVADADYTATFGQFADVIKAWVPERETLQ